MALTMGVAVVEEQGRAGVDGGDAGHLVVGEGEVEDVEVRRHPLGSNRLGDGDDVALGEPAEHDLGDGLAVGGADLGQGGVGEQVVAALGEPPQDSCWTPCPAMVSWSACRWK